MNNTCKQCNTSFEVTTDDQGFYEKIGVPTPSFCPDCRYQRRLGNRNEWNFYKRNCSLCSKNMVSLYNPSYSGPVYCIKCWWSDDWDPLEYGKEYDPSVSFFDQFKEVRFRVPKVTLAQVNSVNSEYTNQSIDNKNCYMVVATGRSEDCLYGNWMVDAKQCADCYAIEDSELLYESLNCTKCYNSSFLEHCASCNDSFFLYDCRGCSNCFGCVGLRNKSYCWFNEQLTKEEYQERLKNFEFTNIDIEETEKKVKKLELQYPHKYYNGRMNINFSGDYIENVKASTNVFNARHVEDIRYSQDAWYAKTSLDLTEVWENELDYELEGVGGSARSIALSKTTETFDSAYTDNCYTNEYIFGCISLRNKKYCILNKQYTKEEYLALKKKIVEQMKKDEEWGEFFPMRISSFAYNESVAQDYFSHTKAETQEKGLRWYDRDDREYSVTIKHEDLPKTIKETGDDILQEVISCKSQDSENSKKKHISCATAFRITKAELDFYKKKGLPIPNKCFPCRLQDRLALRNPRKLYPRQCMCDYTIHKNTVEHTHHQTGECPNEFETSYSPDREEIVYCEACYNAEVV